MGKGSAAPQLKLDALCGIGFREVEPFPKQWIYPSKAGSRVVPIFKVLMSNVCENNCLYCASRAGRSFREYSFAPEELAATFAMLYEKGLVKGIFLSSGIEQSPNKTMERMLKAIEIIRFKQGFKGYVHLKLMPGAERSYIERVCQLATRVSVNLEAPGQERLKRISPKKDFDSILDMIKETSRIIEDKNVSQTSQFVIGAADESDREILELCEGLHREYKLKRCYFEAFRPIPRTPLEEKPATPKRRESRIYQADMLLRDYGFSAEELIFDNKGNLALDKDPKLLWALSHPEKFPIEINNAPRGELRRVPGIGNLTASKIIEMRAREKIRGPSQLKFCGMRVSKASPFILLDGKKASPQLPL
jgi:predicted DNA-binding helix-hairpin-helix protein